MIKIEKKQLFPFQMHAIRASKCRSRLLPHDEKLLAGIDCIDSYVDDILVHFYPLGMNRC